MDREQEKIAEKVIAYLKNCDGRCSVNLLSTEIPEISVKNKFSIYGGLGDRGLIKDSINATYRLTEAGWDFKSFKKLRNNLMVKKIKENISFILNIMLIAVTIYITTVNDDLSKNNSTLKENIIQLKARLSILETQIHCPQNGLEISHIDNTK